MENNAAKPIEETIRVRAYYRFLDRQRDAQDGSAVEDWLSAEAECADETHEPSTRAHIVAGHGAEGHPGTEREDQKGEPGSHAHIDAGHAAGGNDRKGARAR